MKTKANKSFKTYEEQIEILTSKGLICNDSSIEILKRSNYYFLINRYKDCFIIPNSKPNLFKKGTTFDEIVALYHFDRDLRSIVLKYIILIENTLKSIISHEFSKKYGYGYLDRNNFLPTTTAHSDEILEKRIRNLFASIKSTIAQGKKNNKYIKHYSSSYEKIPLWVVINDLSLGLTIKFFKLLKDEDRAVIASQFDSTSTELESFLNILNYFRNLAAHNQRLFDECYNENIVHTKIHNNLNLNNYKSNLMSLLIVFKILLLDAEFESLSNEISLLLNKLDKEVNTITNTPIINKMGLNKFEDLKKL